MSKARWLQSLWLINATIVFMSLCLSCGCKEKTPASDRGNAIKIGAVLPLTGPVASYGKFAQGGIDLAISEINKAGGINGRKLQVEYQDDRGETKEAVTIMKKFTEIDKYPVVIGAAASSTSVALAPMAERSETVLFSPISSTPDLTVKGGPYFFRVCPSDAFQARILADWMWSRGLKAVAILYVNNSWGVSIKEEFTTFFRKAGGTIILEEAANEGDRDFRTQIAKMKATPAQAFLVLTYGKEGGAFVRQARELGVTVPLFGGDVWGSPEFVETGGNAANGCFFTVPAPPSGDRFDKFKEAFRAKHRKAPEVYACYSYDLVMIVAAAMRAGTMHGPTIQEYLRGMPEYEGVTGITKFDDNNDVTTKSFVRRVIKDGMASPIAD